ncbi:MAG: hypothetical protein J6A56_02315 [Clostridia bacterium]|nr:hypothetical protein [Clostridia bacterium]
MSLETVIGNDSIKALLTKALESGRIGHAYIIEGKRGSGKMTLAKAFAARILKTENPETHPDFTVVTNQLYDSSKRKENVLVDTIRSMKRDVYIKPYMDGKKVYVIPLADTMQAPAQNSLLKVFEEPPTYCTIILLAENANAFLPTILSRAPVLRMQPLADTQVEEFLIQEKNTPREKARQLAVLSGGAIGRALELLEDEPAIALREETLSLFLAMAGGTYRDMYDFVKFLKQNKTDISLILEILLAWCRDVMYRKLQLQEVPITNGDKNRELIEFCSRLPKDAALQLSEIVVKYQRMIEQNVNYSVAVLCMATDFWEEIHGRNYRS